VQIPSKIGRYEVIDRLATGGMAEVFICSEHGMAGLERLVVVKRILPHLARHAQFIEMFLDEARYMARLNHPNVVNVHELGEDDGLPYLAMEYVPGASVRQILISAIELDIDTPLGAAIGIILQACAGAHAAHELTDPKGMLVGLVHRDISPQNLVVTIQGNVKLLDFGIAKATESPELDDDTRTALKGKVSYMAPEQCKQESLDRRADVFALGIVVWEMLAQARLFKRESDLESMQAIVGGDIKNLRTIRPDIPATIVDAIERALDKDKAERYATADQMRRALVDACARENVRCDIDMVASFVKPLLGEAHIRKTADLLLKAEERTRAGEEERTAVSSPSVSAPSRPLVTPVVEPRQRSRAGLWLLFAAALIGGGLFGRMMVEVPTGAPIVFAFPATANPDLVLGDLGGLASHLESSTHRPVKLIVSDSYEGLTHALLTGEAALASLPPNAYVQAKKTDPAIAILASKVVDGASGVDGVIYVRDSSKIATLLDLRGVKFCFPDPLSTTGYVLPRRAIRRAGLDPDHDIVPHISGKHTQVLRDLVDGVCEAGATYSGGYVAADRAGVPVAQLRQLAITGRAPRDAICASPKVTAAESAMLQQALLSYRPKAAAQEDTRVEHISGFEKATDAEYDAIRDALAD